MKAMPCGLFQLWHPVNNEEPESPSNMQQVFQKDYGFRYAQSEIEYLEWRSWELGEKVGHRFNGRQHVIQRSPTVRYYVDGYVPSLRLIIQFNGCYYHAHKNCLLKRSAAIDNNVAMERRR